MSPVVSPDGRSVYAVGVDDSAVVRFDRDPDSGSVVYRGCLSGDRRLGAAGTGACALIPSARDGGTLSGLGRVQALVISPDGRDVYATADGGITHFARDGSSGALRYAGCLTGDVRLGDGGAGQEGNGTCDEIPSATPRAYQSGMAFASPIAISPDGRSVYAGSPEDNAINRFRRNPSTGALLYQGCISGEKGVPGEASGTACVQTDRARPFGFGSGLASPAALAIDDDGRSLYGAAFADSAVARFTRNPSSGALTYRDCTTGKVALVACKLTPHASSSDDNSGLTVPSSLALSPDGRSLYVGGADGVARFSRDPATTEVTFAGCITGDAAAGPQGNGACAAIPSATRNFPNSDSPSNGAESGLAGVASVVASPDGSAVFATSQIDHSVSRFARDPASGALAYEGCLTGRSEIGEGGTGACLDIPSAHAGLLFFAEATNSGLSDPRSITIDPSGQSLYVAAVGDAALSHLGPELLPGRCENRLGGTEGGEDLYGTQAGDSIAAGAGDDVISGGDGRDCIGGQAGSDNETGAAGGDRLSGGAGSDDLSGNGGADKLFAGSGKDELNGGSGGDTLVAKGGGKDVVKCGKGDDTAKADKRDVLKSC